MSHRLDKKQAARAERLRLEAEARKAEQRQRVVRRAGYGIVGVIAAALVTLAVALNGGNNTAPAGDDMASHKAGNGPAVGAKAPDFALTDVVHNRQVTAKSLRGRKTMLFFSEGVNCQPCIIQAAKLQQTGALEKKGIQLVSVTTDPADQLAQAAQQYGVHTPMLADPSMKMSSAYGMLGHGGMGHPTQDGHAFMLLDEQGKVLWHEAYSEMYVEPAQLLADMNAEAVKA
jgi:peroxiredoxin Q/BCP